MTVILDGKFERKYLVCDTRPVGEDAALEKGVELLFDKLGQSRPGLQLDLGQEGLEVFSYQLVEDGVFGTPAFVV
ncbi:MAG: hypothetical protein ACREXS_10880 [Gammaproteobacteria bacterium]